MDRRVGYFAGLIALAILVCGHASAEPYLAVRYGLKCTSCHVNPTGGGLRSNFGDVFAQTELPAHPIRGNFGLWTGAVTSWLRIGGDFRYDDNFTQTPGAKSTNHLQTQQGRLYAEAEPIPNRLIFYVDEQMTPGDPINHEAYAILWSASHDWYVKAGRMYLPFGFRLEDQTAFVYDVSSITMYAPDNGLEFGWLHGHWDAQVTVSNATAAGALPSTDGKEYGLQMSYVESAWRLGVAAHDDDSPFARRKILGVFGGTRTGPVTWLAEVDGVDNEYAPVAGEREAGRAGRGRLAHRGGQQSQGHAGVSRSRPGSARQPPDTVEFRVRADAYPVPAATSRRARLLWSRQYPVAAYDAALLSASRFPVTGSRADRRLRSRRARGRRPRQRRR